MAGSDHTTDSRTFDYSTGPDLAQKRGDELSQLGAAQSKALMDGDLAASMAQRRRIKDLQGYINAYKSGGAYNGAFGEVVQPGRLASTSDSYTDQGL